MEAGDRLPQVRKGGHRSARLSDVERREGLSAGRSRGRRDERRANRGADLRDHLIVSRRLLSVLRRSCPAAAIVDRLYNPWVGGVAVLVRVPPPTAHRRRRGIPTAGGSDFTADGRAGPART